MLKIQNSNVTGYDRYPAIFSRASDLSQNLIGKLNICSFGCSTGEEVVTLSEKYFSGHNIFGCEINNLALEKAVERCKGIVPKVRLVSDIRMLDTEFDFLFAMSVFCHWPKSASLNNLSQIYNFEQFEKDMFELRNKIKIGGYLVLHNTNYYFEDTKAFLDFNGVKPMSTSKVFGSIPRFDENGELLPCGRTKDGLNGFTSRPGYVFFKRLK